MHKYATETAEYVWMCPHKHTFDLYINAAAGHCNVEIGLKDAEVPPYIHQFSKWARPFFYFLNKVGPPFPPTWLLHTLFEIENEWQKTEQVPISFPRASRNFSEKQENSIFFYNWTSEMIPFIRFGQDLDFFLKCQKLHLL